ncbi:MULTISPECIES: GntR family transcriptional regulator [Rhizobium]|uniref:GntR family transcriptional regulator n=1 Tax=Rhizobium tropici TaxID=398 RepID=A0A329YDX0_RHITR|nr:MULTISPECIES: GntR family transcriptional regulator [Rhizobium]MBB3285797.1 DNA-binding GntR family transcriptional regulator [Rhizobium sp. BK252]MBB3400537.1 DNA-binding GntR family transcriptional regulator [Rhizobium sp. BK289]MBB3413116.1 DNA-binding GntR family transcriptional regulator [Rhizobium sp. BK284]MBB3481003.1 DNA-binding GntR family transcriptional regulator [Rhizobium sp. BK347]MDK4721677.1 GntR family transcriptional regulator [Rhizobium sp. CNPSo 3968]
MSVSHLESSGLRKTRLYEELHGRLKAEILAGAVPDGLVVTEAALAGLVGSSRAPVRQALQLLLEDGLIARFDGRGFIVGVPGTPPKRVKLDNYLGNLLDENSGRPAFAWQALYEDVERIVVHRSVFGRYRINENELARHFGVGRGVARDVLLKLETLGITEKDDNFRWSIVPLDAQRIRDLYEVREQIEPVALASALDGLSSDHVEAMLARLSQALADYPDVTASTMYELELDLHLRSLQACPNKEFLNILKRTHCILTLSKHIVGSRIKRPDHEPFLAEHIGVFEMVQKRDEQGLRKAMRDHISNSQPNVQARAAYIREHYQPDEYSFIT